MAVSAVIKLEQYSGPTAEGSVRNSTFVEPKTAFIREDDFTTTSEYIFTHLPHVSQPVSRPGVRGWGTESKEDWSDSPARQPLLLYRNRFAFGRDRKEIFDTGYGTPLVLGAAGARWGDLDRNSGVLEYERTYPMSATGTVRQFRVASSVHIHEMTTSLSSEATISHLPELTADHTIQQFPFLVFALPKPFSYRNPVDTDVFIRLSNYAFPLASGTINLYLDEVLKEPLQISEFFGGLGGFDVLWVNDQLFDYDSTVLVRWEFFDTDTPANKVVIAYEFYTVPDLAPPRAINLVPAASSIDVPVLGPIQFDLVDFETEVDISTLVLYVNNSKVIDGENGTLVITELESGGYTVQFTPEEPWLYGDLIPVAIFVNDTSIHHNELFFTYSFTTELSLAPRLINPDPYPCTVGVPVGTNIEVDVIDGGHGLDKDSILLTVEEVERGGTILLIPIVHRDE